MSPAARVLTLAEAIGIGALALVLAFPRARWSRAARVPVAIIAFATSAASLFSHIL